MNKLILSLGIALWAVSAQGQISQRLDSLNLSIQRNQPAKLAQMRLEERKIHLDSMVEEKKNKSYYIYDDLGISKYIEYKWDTLSKNWKPVSMGEQTFYPNEYLASTTSHRWNDVSMNWDTLQKQEYSYNAKGAKTRILVQGWSEMQATWDSLYNYEYVYDDKNRLISYVPTTLQKYSNQWESSQNIHYTYDANGNLTQKKDSTWNSPLNDDYRVFEYDQVFDDKNNVTTSLHYQKASHLWGTEWRDEPIQLIYKYDYTYNSNNSIVSYNYYYGASNPNRWVRSNRGEYFYNANKKVDSTIVYAWDEGLNNWVLQTKNEYVYDMNGIVVMSTTYKWDITTKQWMGDTKCAYIFDNRVPNDSLETPTDYLYGINKIDTIISSSFVAGAWLVDAKYFFYYSNTTISGLLHDETIGLYTSYYPNPSATGIFNQMDGLAIQHIRVSNMANQVIIDTDNTPNGLDLSHYPKGIYIAQIRAKQGTSVQRLVIE